LDDVGVKMGKEKPKLTQAVFEARYDQGYRYLDRCGDVMIILEQALPGVTDNKIWMPEEMLPTGARMKCPDLDLTIVFDTHRLCIDQSPVDKECAFEEISRYIWNTLVSKFEIKNATRFGRRKIYILPADSVEGGEKLSVNKAPFHDWLTGVSTDLKPRKCEVSTTLENEDRSKGTRFSIDPVFKLDAPLEIDKRLTVAPHQLPTGQREALMEQLKRIKQRQEDPVAGLMIDIDYWWIRREKMEIQEFYKESETNIAAFLKTFLGA
jgi:hypothetical protein